ncbi:hypothetical protein B0H13DRAFT_2409569 [Mycena leptocephala]|nr:hypothetical protein B0H13DRAFT_2409569 [Mycena leptocephala]
METSREMETQTQMHTYTRGYRNTAGHVFRERTDDKQSLTRLPILPDAGVNPVKAKGATSASTPTSSACDTPLASRPRVSRTCTRRQSTIDNRHFPVRFHDSPPRRRSSPAPEQTPTPSASSAAAPPSDSKATPGVRKSRAQDALQESSAGRTTTPSALLKSRRLPKVRQRRANLSIGIAMGTGTGGARPPTRTAGSELKSQKSEGEADLSLRSSLCLPHTDTRCYERHSTPRALHSGSRTNLGHTDMDTDRTDAFLRRPHPHLGPRPALALLPTE